MCEFNEKAVRCGCGALPCPMRCYGAFRMFEQELGMSEQERKVGGMKNDTISVTGRIVRSFMAAVLALLVLVSAIPILHSYASPTDPETFGGSRTSEEDVQISKTCIQRPGLTDQDFTDDGYPVYDMNLTFNGFGDEFEEQEPLDVMFILDVSGSMVPESYHPWCSFMGIGRDPFGGNTMNQDRTQYAADAINTFVRLANENNLDTRYMLIEFAGHYAGNPAGSFSMEERLGGATAYYDSSYTPYNDAGVEIDWTPASDIQNNTFVTHEKLLGDVPGNPYRGKYGHLTNYDAGLYTAYNELSEIQDNGRRKVVIFLTDGNPNRYYYLGNGTYYGRTGEQYIGYPMGENSTGLVPEAATASNNGAASLPLTSDDYFFGVAFSEAVTTAGSYNMEGMTNAVAQGSGATTAAFRNQNANQLSGTVAQIFNDVYTQTTTTCTNVTIHDVMSDNVEFYGTDNDIRVMRSYLDENNEVQEVDDTANWVISHQGKNITATHTAAVDPNSTYRLTYPVRASDQTRQNYTNRDFAADGEYPDTADTETGTYAGQTGYDTNIQSPENPDGTGTYVDFTKDVNVNGTHTTTDYSKPYPEPVIRQHRLIITKTIRGVDDLTEQEVNALIQKLEFTVAGSNVQDGTQTPRFSKTVNYNVAQTDGTVALSNTETTTDGSGKKTYTFHYTMNVPGGETYTITESNAELALHDWSAEDTEQSVPFDTNSEGYATFTNNYELYLNLILHKARMNSNPTEYLNGAKFQLYEVVDGVETPVGEEFEVADGETGVRLKLHDGSYILRETRAPNGYMLAEDVAFEVVGGHVTGIDNNLYVFAQELEASGEEEAATSLTIFDVKIYELPSTGGSGIYGYMIGGSMMIILSVFALTWNPRRKRGGAAE